MFQRFSYLERCCFGGGVISYNNKLTWSTKNQHMQHARSFLIGPSHQLLKVSKRQDKRNSFSFSWWWVSTEKKTQGRETESKAWWQQLLNFHTWFPRFHLFFSEWLWENFLRENSYEKGVFGPRVWVWVLCEQFQFSAIVDELEYFVILHQSNNRDSL